jgi:hypothetical protein
VAIADNQKLEPGLDPDMLRGAVHWHHKVLPDTGRHREIIEACRKADWIDALTGTLRKGMSRVAIAKVEAAFPNLGFHDTLLRLTKEYEVSTLVGSIKVTFGIINWKLKPQLWANEPLTWTDHRPLSAGLPQAHCLPLRDSVQRIGRKAEGIDANATSMALSCGR